LPVTHTNGTGKASHTSPGQLDSCRTQLTGSTPVRLAGAWKGAIRWAAGAALAGLDPAAVNETTHVLHRCGQRWRAVLSGEKDATDLLQTGDFVNAARGTLARAAAIARAVALRLWAPLTVAAILIAVGIWLIIANHGDAQVIAGLGTIAGGLGITWRSAAGALGHLSLHLVRPLWEAQVDVAVAARLTPEPQRDYVPGLERPRGRWRRAWRELRAADPQARRGAPAKPDPSQP
jgi:hypothetical protein